MKVVVLATGSKANCTYIEHEGCAILVDCGLSAKQVELRLRSVGLGPELLEGIVVTHEHRDHIAGISVMSRRYKLPVFCNWETANYIDNIFLHEPFQTGGQFNIGPFQIKSFSTVHDASDPSGFRIEAGGKVFVALTDIGKVTMVVKQHTRGCHGILLESNHDLDLLQDCHYPWELKQRIASAHGHLSNDDAAKLLKEIDHPGLQHVILGHLSENSNCPEAVHRTMRKTLNVSRYETFICGSVHEPTPVIEIGERTLQKTA